jgi:hypothetical protein
MKETGRTAAGIKKAGTYKIFEKPFHFLLTFRSCGGLYG